MRFPESERITYEIDTLVEVICQARIPRILQIGTRPPDAFQEVIRGDYPVYRRQEPLVGLPPELEAAVSPLQLGAAAALVTHWFENEEGDRSISLTMDFVAVTARRYPGWEAMRTSIDGAFAALQEA